MERVRERQGNTSPVAEFDGWGNHSMMEESRGGPASQDA